MFDLLVITKYCCFRNFKQGVNDLFFFHMVNNHCLMIFLLFMDILCTMQQRYKLKFTEILYDRETGKHKLTFTASALGRN